MAEKFQIKKSSIASAVCIAAVILLLIFGGRVFGNQQYYAVSLMVILLSMVPFFLAFESRKPQAREVVTLAVMCALAVASRAVFIWLPHFKPMTAIIMIAGAAFGAEAGFLTGAVSAFVSNFLFGQGPWTPWQMLAFGIAGFLVGLLCNKGILSKKRIPLSIFGGIAVLVLIGPILDTSTLFMTAASVTQESAAAVYLSGLPVNAVHALATFLTLLLVSQPLFEKLDRIKLKYGMMEADREV